MSDPYEKYFEFHGRDVRKERRVVINDPPETLIVLGKAIAIEYETDKFHGGGDGKKAVYRHEFETPCLVCMDETGKRMLYITGKRLTVTQAGIEN